MMLGTSHHALPSNRMVLRSNFPRLLYSTSYGSDLHSSSPPRTAHRYAHAKPCFAWEEKRSLGITTPEELEKRIRGFKRLAQEARLCIGDCAESIERNDFDEELLSAKIAVNAAGMAYSELLEELALTDEGVGVLNEVRKSHASVVESLRQELQNIAKSNDEEK